MSEINVKALRWRSQQSVKETVETNRNNYQKSKENQDDVFKAIAYHSALESVREERARNLRYKNGDQWSDIIIDPETGKHIRESALIQQQGKNPLKHNFIQQYIKNINGQAILNNKKSMVVCRSTDDIELGEMLTNTLQSCKELNRFDILRLNALEELVISGICIGKVRYDFWSTKNRADGKIEAVNINRAFFNTEIEDPRFMADLNFIGEIHDYTFSELLRNFAHTTEDEKELGRMFYTSRDELVTTAREMKKDNTRDINAFMDSLNPDRCRVLEIWKKKGRWVNYVHDHNDGTEKITLASTQELEQQNQQRLAQLMQAGIDPRSVDVMMDIEPRYEHYWSVRFLTVDGFCLKEMETPYAHEEHPYIIGVLPMIGGTIRSAIGDLIDNQRYINRLIVMIDFIMGNSAKGVLMVPESAVPDGMSVEDFATEYVKADGVILYKGTPSGEKPYQIAKNTTNVGAWEMLSMQMQLMEKISGISGAMQGQQAANSKPSSLYAQEAQNSSVNLAPIFNALSEYVSSVDEKILKVLMQFYTDVRHVGISGSGFSEFAKTYQPEMAKSIIDFNIVIAQSLDTPVFKMETEKALQELLKMGVIDAKMFLENSNMPFAKKILASMEGNINA